MGTVAAAGVDVTHPVGDAAGRYMEAFGVTRAHLAASLGVARNTVRGWFAGTHRIPLDAVAGIERVLGLPRGRLLIDAGYVDVAANAEFDRGSPTDDRDTVNKAENNR